MKYLEDYIKEVEAVKKNSLNNHEIEQITEAVRLFVLHNSESVEGMFDPDEESEELVISVKAF